MKAILKNYAKKREIYIEGEFSEYSFRHALLQSCLYNKRDNKINEGIGED